ncbi:ATP-binding cassette domain-containing protein [Candidatus Phytoplasma pruni]|uniref:ATP-binding cassette domain-containing protein n=1 Tax=Candidatus Phytoplasma pruni TaxID=479893 RepID=A0A851HHP0_9MOLU|nr:ATP-binding cassette domain-containing protein [Candidatus Phytoplasma pruni]NWN46100.1 ATP-binding cassette domain-containing protein [Candidatus Phytoplasma pruni]
MFEITNINKGFVTKAGIPTIALNNVSLKLPNKGLIFILGKSGSGKSTLLNLLGGLDQYDSGNIAINKHSTQALKQNDLDNYRNGVVGFIFQEFNLMESMNVYDNIALANELQGQKPDSQLIYDLLKEMDLLGYEGRKINELSGGQKQRIAIARALVKNPEIILADEPTGNLDSKTSEQIFNILQNLSKDKLVVVVSHDAESAFKYGNRVIEFKDGQILEDLTKDENAVKTKKPKFTKGQVLNEEMIKQIQDQAKNAHKEGFVPTQEVLLEEQPVTFKNVSSQLPLKKAFKMGASAFKSKKVLLVFSALIVVFSSILFRDILRLGLNMKEFYLEDRIEQEIKFRKKYNHQKYANLEELKEKVKEEVNINWPEIKNRLKKQIKYLIIFLAVMLLISFMMIYMYFNASIKLKKKEVGSLRALGARGSTVSKIFLSEGFIYATIINILIFAFDIIMGFSFGFVYIYDLTKGQYWLFLGAGYLFAYVLTFLSIILPIYTLSRKKPIDVIANR